MEYLIRDVNPKWFHYNYPLLVIGSGQLNAQAMSHGLVDHCRPIEMGRCGPDQARYA